MAAAAGLPSDPTLRLATRLTLRQDPGSVQPLMACLSQAGRGAVSTPAAGLGFMPSTMRLARSKVFASCPDWSLLSLNLIHQQHTGHAFIQGSIFRHVRLAVTEPGGGLQMDRGGVIGELDNRSSALSFCKR